MEGPRRVGDVAAVALCLAVAAIGLLAIAGWHFRAMPLVQFLPNTVPIQYNTAVTFVILGAASAWLALGKAERWPVLLGGALVLSSGLMGMAEHVLHINPGFDTFLFDPWDQTLVTSPGRMSLITATGFTLAGGGLVYRTLGPNREFILGIIAAPPLALSASSLLGHMVGVDSFRFPLLQPSAQMAIGTSLGLIFWAAAMGRLAWHARPEVWMPWAAAFGYLAFAVALEILETSSSLLIQVVRFAMLLGGMAVVYFAALYLKDLRDGRRRALSLVRLQEEVIGTVAHDVKGPLSAVTMAFSLLQDTDLAKDPEQAEKIIGAAQRSLDKIECLVGELLDRERTASGFVKLSPEPCEAGDLVDQAIESVQAAATEKNLTIDVRVPDELTVQADPLRTYQILLNLVGNAVKFAPDDTRIEVSVEARQAEALFVVADEGPGIPAEHLSRIFERFHQVEGNGGGNGDSRKRGHGLGLAICRTLVEVQGGRIWVESEPNKGSRFFFTLPLTAKKRSVAR